MRELTQPSYRQGLAFGIGIGITISILFTVCIAAVQYANRKTEYFPGVDFPAAWAAPVLSAQELESYQNSEKFRLKSDQNIQKFAFALWCNANGISEQKQKELEANIGPP